MAKKILERKPVLDPAVADLLAGMEQRQSEAQLPRKQREKKARERARIQSRRASRATYDLPPYVRTNIQKLAEQHSLPISQLVTLALIRFMGEYKDGQIDLGKFKITSKSPKYDWVLDLNQELKDLKEKRNLNLLK
jgi:hypothetical protein